MTPATDRLLIMYGILLQHPFLCYSSGIQSIIGFLYGQRERLFVTELNNKHFTRQIFHESFFECLSLMWPFASITS